MDMLGYINAEGGPLLLLDSFLVPYWKGSEGEDYERACAIFDSNPGKEGAEIDIATGMGIVWEMQGPGTAVVFRRSESYLCIVRIWPHDPKDSRTPWLIADQEVKKDRYIGNLSLESGRLAILWAPENGSVIGVSSDADVSRPTGDMAIETSGLIVSVSRPSYACFHDIVETSVGSGRRLHLISSQ